MKEEHRILSPETCCSDAVRFTHTLITDSIEKRSPALSLAFSNRPCAAAINLSFLPAMRLALSRCNPHTREKPVRSVQ